MAARNQAGGSSLSSPLSDSYRILRFQYQARETDCRPLHIESDDGGEVASYNEMMAKRQKIDHGGTTSSIDHQKIKVASAACPSSSCEMIFKRCELKNHLGETTSSCTNHHQNIKVASASSLCDFCANFADRFGFVHEGLYSTVTSKDVYRFRKQNTEKMLLQRKLHLVINLDHTFLTHTKLSCLTPEESEYMKTLEADSPDVFTVRVPPKMEPVVIKFRPFLRTFLKEASELFEIYAFANAPRSLVWKIVELLDPRNEYFGRRVISPEYFVSRHKGKKSINQVLGQKSAVLIIDDDYDGWTMSSGSNIIPSTKYCFFEKIGKKRKRKSLCELKSDDGASSVASLLEIIKSVHNRFFNDEVMCDNLFERDVRMHLKIEYDTFLDGGHQLWRKALANFLRKKVAPAQQLKMAEQSSTALSVDKQVDHDSNDNGVAQVLSSGATYCVEEQADDLSSLEIAEAAHVGKSPARWCHPSWIDISIRLWQKRHVHEYPVMTEDSKFSCSSCGCSSYMNTPKAKPLCNSSFYLPKVEKTSFPLPIGDVDDETRQLQEMETKTEAN